MCGIIAIKNTKNSQPVNQAIRIIYENQKSRGTDGFGFVGLSKKEIRVFRSTFEKGILDYLDENNFDEILFHHRNPTSTKNNLSSTHPFIVDIPIKHKKYYIVHNGIITNDDELYAKHKELGIKYKSESESGLLFNDSEALAWEFALWLNGLIDKFKAKGSIALIGLEIDRRSNKALKLYFYRNSIADLRILRTKDILILSSEGKWNKVKANRVYYYDYKSKLIKKYQKLVVENKFKWSYGYYDDYDTKYDKVNRPYSYLGQDWKERNQEIKKRAGLDKYKLTESEEEDPPVFYDSNDEGILDSIPALEDRLSDLKQEQSSLIVGGSIKEANSLDEEIEEVERLIKECKRYFNNPFKTDEERRNLLSEITLFVYGH